MEVLMGGVCLLVLPAVCVAAEAGVGGDLAVSRAALLPRIFFFFFFFSESRWLGEWGAHGRVTDESVVWTEAAAVSDPRTQRRRRGNVWNQAHRPVGVGCCSFIVCSGEPVVHQPRGYLWINTSSDFAPPRRCCTASWTVHVRTGSDILQLWLRHASSRMRGNMSPQPPPPVWLRSWGPADGDQGELSAMPT